jgi:site-specific DNA recombinase
MRLIGYIRVSSETQADNASLEDQRKRIEAYCVAHGHTLVKVFEEVGSGKNAKDRPEFQAALEALQGADGLIAYRLDRVARNTRDVLTLVEDVLEPQNKALVLLDLQVDTSKPTGKMVLTIMAAVASLEREVIKERTMIGRQAKKDAGEWYGGRPPYGYRLDNGALVEVPEELEAVEIIRRHHKSGKSLRAIATYLTDKGYQTKRGGKWNATQVKDILDRLKKPKTVV